MLNILLTILLLVAVSVRGGYNVSADPRNIYAPEAAVMLETAYADQPYCAITLDGTWNCPTTVDAAHEGGAGEQVTSLWSTDGGKSWDPRNASSLNPVDKNATTLGITNAYSAIVTTGKRSFVVYNDNFWNITKDPSGQSLSRKDTVGAFLLRWTDNQGRSWSSDYVRIPVEVTAIDRDNTFKGSQQMFWNVDAWKTVPYNVTEGYPQGSGSLSCMFAYTKIGNYPYNPPEEVYVLASDNLLQVGESDPSTASFQLLPHADHGIAPPGGNPNIGEEPHVVPILLPKARQGALADPTEDWPSSLTPELRRSLQLPVNVDYFGFYVAFRNTQGYLAAAYTADTTGKAGWAPTGYAKFACVGASVIPDPYAQLPCGSLKYPRGPLQMRFVQPAPASSTAVSGGTVDDAVTDGVYFLLFYFNSYPSYAHGRNPYWLSAGRVSNLPNGTRTILWSQPEIVLYDRNDPDTRPGYPDIVQDLRAASQPSGKRESPSPSGGSCSWGLTMTETQKTTARAHPLSDDLLSALAGQWSAQTIRDGNYTRLGAYQQPQVQTLPRLQASSTVYAPRAGLTIDVSVTNMSLLDVGDFVLDASEAGGGARASDAGASGAGSGSIGQGIRLGVVQGNGTSTVELQLADRSQPEGQSMVRSVMDDACGKKIFAPGVDTRRLAVVADGNARVVFWVVDGTVCDGGQTNQAGFSWFQGDFADLNTADQRLTVLSKGGSDLSVDGLLYDEALLVSELVGNYRAAAQA